MRDNERTLRRWKTAVAIFAALVLYALPSSALLAASNDSGTSYTVQNGPVTLSVNGHYGAILAQ